MTRPRIILVLAAVILLVAVGVGGVGAARGWFAYPSVPSSPDGTVASQSDVVTDLGVPWGLAFLPDGRALVTERDTARVLAVQGNTATEVTTVDEARPAGEGGLLGIAYAPAGDWVYVYYTAAGDNRIARFHPGQPDARQTVFTGIPKSSVHN